MSHTIVPGVNNLKDCFITSQDRGPPRCGLHGFVLALHYATRFGTENLSEEFSILAQFDDKRCAASQPFG